MSGQLRTMLRRVRDHLAASRDPEAFVRSLGVNLTGRVRFYGVNRAMFGSEPWLITIGDNVYVTSQVQFVTHDGGTLILRKDHPELDWTAPITIGDDVYIGMRSMILAGVVTRDIPDNTVAAGVPARPLRSTDEYLERLQAKSLGIGHLPVPAKHEAMKRIYGVTTG
jgi:acetyltransferase-like isoleucine patch superfamily enzyme